jgi:SIR2-like domain
MVEGPLHFDRPLPLKGLRLATTEEMEDRDEDFRPAIIFGQGNKLTAEGPYLELLRRFLEDLEDYSTLLVIGYSFCDPHVNHYIARWFNDEPNRHVIVLNGEGFAQQARAVPLSSGEAPFVGDRPFIQDLVFYGRDRVHIVHKTAADGLGEAVAMARNNTI